MTFKDYFSGHAGDYAAHRPTYPDALFTYLASCCDAHDLAWDCATGNGQSARQLAAYFQQVLATDGSQAQLDQAPADPQITYQVGLAEESGIAAGVADLVTVSQALHWFDRETFYREVQRVLKPGGVLAVWCYGLMQISAAVDAVILHLYRDVVGPYWPPERSLVEDQYRSLPFPFADLSPPDFQMQLHWTLPQLLGYLDTWSACRRYQAATGQRSLDQVQSELTTAWGDPTVPRQVIWPLGLRVGRHPA